MSWLFLLAAILLEVAGTSMMNLAEGFTKLVPSALIFLLYALSLAALTVSLKQIDLSVAYAVWSGLGTALIALIGVLWFREPLTALKIGSLVLIVAGVVGLNLGGAG
jgi:small multidrug resistance pump